MLPSADRLVLLVFTLTVATPWVLLLFVTSHHEGCPAAAEEGEAAVLYNPVLHAALIVAYAAPPWFTLATTAARAAEDLGGYDYLTHRRLQWIIVARLVPVWCWLHAFLYNYRHDEVPVLVAGVMLLETCAEMWLVGCESSTAVQLGAVCVLVIVSAEDARLCGERLF